MEAVPYPAEARAGAALKKATDALLAELGPNGHWTGELSPSALSTATAVIALTKMAPGSHPELIGRALAWLVTHQNKDGGWGDTPQSKSNISTTALVWAAFGLMEKAFPSAMEPFRSAISAAETWLQVGSNAAPLAARIAARYGKDRTFSVPILMTLALCGRDAGNGGWAGIPKLPFELAALSHRFWGALRLPVVSYALPALIAIGQVIDHFAPTRNPVTRLLRTATRRKTLRVLETLQPPNGGFLEATPLTSFVTMSLAAMGLQNHPVALRGRDFLHASARPDGSWPIDTNLATWTSTLAIKALAEQSGTLSPEQRLTLKEWLLGQQWREEHPYTHAAPGGWAWTDLPGGVPDADNTPGALLALLKLGVVDEATQRAGISGVEWLLGLQNRDGGIPTFCRGWGALPFDQSSPDLTAHTLRAWNGWRSLFPDRARLDQAIGKAIGFLAKQQRTDGSWLPLWFGNEHAPDDINPLYGTSHVVVALRELTQSGLDSAAPLARKGAKWIADNQNDDGGWGGMKGMPSSTEETALAVEALARSEHVTATDRGVAWLVERVENGTWREPAPIGFYFAKLWYWERLYPMIWTVGALGRALGGQRDGVKARD